MKWLRFVDLGVFLVLAAIAGRHWRNDLHHWIGAAIAIPSFCLWMIARRQLGDSFAVRAEAETLVTHGLYAKIRNPIYIFGGLSFIGMFLAQGWYIWTAIFLLFNVGQYFRSKREEQVLAQAFGDEYLAYKAKTWF